MQLLLFVACPINIVLSSWLCHTVIEVTGQFVMGFVIVAVLPTESLAVIVEKSSPHFHPKIVLGNLINEESHCILRKCLTFLIFQICDLFASVITSLFLILL